jgi:dienelactone hydrolase
VRTSPSRRRTLGIAIAVVVLCAAAALLLLRDPTPRFLERRSRLVAVTEDSAELIDGHWVQTVALRASSGLEVNLAVKGPAMDTSSARKPLIVLLGGHRTGRDAVGLIGDTRGTVVAALSYPYRGNPRLKGLAVVKQVPAIRDAVLDTPPALMLALDYLAARPDVDSQRIEAVGVSLGAPFVCIVGALDHRITRVWSIHGSGDSYAPLEMNMRSNIRFAPARVLVAGLSILLVSGPRLAPDRWVARISPRPFVMINATSDERMPRASVEKLYAAARQPKEIIWLPGRHVRARPQVVRELVELVLARVVMH